MDDTQFYLLVQEYLNCEETIADCDARLKTIDAVLKELPPIEINESLSEMQHKEKERESVIELSQEMRGEATRQLDLAIQRKRKIPEEIAEHLPEDRWIKFHDKAVRVVCNYEKDRVVEGHRRYRTTHSLVFVNWDRIKQGYDPSWEPPKKSGGPWTVILTGSLVGQAVFGVIGMGEEPGNWVPQALFLLAFVTLVLLTLYKSAMWLFDLCGFED